jgi:hypothetical protein
MRPGGRRPNTVCPRDPKRTDIKVAQSRDLDVECLTIW